MIKSISTLLLTFIFTFTQAMAFAPNKDQVLLEEKLESIDASDLKSKSRVSKKEFEKSQKKIIAGLSKELKKVKKKPIEKQTEFALKKLSKRFKRFRALGKLSLKNKKKIAQIAAQNGKTIKEVEAEYKSNFSKDKEIEVKEELKARIDKHGSYAEAIQAGIEEVQNTTYESVAAAKSEKSEISRKPAQLEALFWAFIVFYLIIPVVLVVLTTLFFATGGIVGGVIFGVAFVGYLLWVLQV